MKTIKFYEQLIKALKNKKCELDISYKDGLILYNEIEKEIKRIQNICLYLITKYSKLK